MSFLLLGFVYKLLAALSMKFQRRKSCLIDILVEFHDALGRDLIVVLNFDERMKMIIYLLTDRAQIILRTDCA